MYRGAPNVEDPVRELRAPGPEDEEDESENEGVKRARDSLAERRRRSRSTGSSARCIEATIYISRKQQSC